MARWRGGSVGFSSSLLRGLEKGQVEKDTEKIRELVGVGKFALNRHLSIQTWAESQPKLVDFFTLEEEEQKEIIDDILTYLV